MRSEWRTLSLRTEFVWSMLQIGAACGDMLRTFDEVLGLGLGCERTIDHVMSWSLQGRWGHLLRVSFDRLPCTTSLTVD